MQHTQLPFTLSETFPMLPFSLKSRHLIKPRHLLRLVAVLLMGASLSACERGANATLHGSGAEKNKQASDTSKESSTVHFAVRSPDPKHPLQSIHCPQDALTQYSWKADYTTSNSVFCRIPHPIGYDRLEVEKGSFAEWLRFLPLKPGKPQVKLFNGDLKGNQTAHFAVIDIDVGTKDLQQCADAVMRMKAEYHFSKNDYSSIHFNYTSGDRVDFSRWINGERPRVSGNTVRWTTGSTKGSDHGNFRNYMDAIFNYAGTLSLAKEMKVLSDIQEIQPGDVFIHGGSPGHAVLVVDVAHNPETKEKLFMLAQSYMPAQEMHILMNPNEAGLSPWYRIGFGETLYTPEWTFDRKELKRF